MRLSSILAPVLLFSLAEAHRDRGNYGVQCQPDHCPCQNECVLLKRHHTCCDRPSSRGKKGRDHHICGPGKECCGKGCCREGWKCSTDGLCRPPGHGPSKGCTTFVTTIVKPITTITKPISTVTHGDGETTDIQGPTTTSGGAPPPGTTGVVTSEPPGDPVSITTTNGPSGVITTTGTSGETIIISNTDTITIPTGITTPIVITGGDGEVSTFFPPGFTTNPGNPVTSDPATTTSAGPSGTPGISAPITITNPDGQVTTIMPPGPSTTEGGTTVVTNPDGQVTTLPDGQVTTILPPGGTDVTAPTGVVTTLPDGQVTTILPPGTEPTTTGDDTVPTGVVTLPDGQVTTILPPDTTTGDGNAPTGVVTTLPDGQVTTVLPPGTTTTGDDNAPTGVVTTLPDGQVTTILTPGTEPTTTGDDNAPTGVVTTLPDGQVTTIVSPDTTTTGDDNVPTGVVTTLPDGQVTTVFPPETTTNVDDIPTGVVTTLPDGQVTTVFPPETTTNVDDVPTGVVTTLPDGQVTTIFPPATTTTDAGDVTTGGVVTTLPDGQVTTIFPPVTTPTDVGDVTTGGVVTTLPDGQVTTIFPPETTTTDAGDVTTGGVVTTLPDGQVTTIFPPAITTTDAGDITTGGVVTTLPDGQVTTIFPPATTTTDGGELPSGGVVTTLPDGQVTTIFPPPTGPTTTEPPTTTTDVPPGGWIIPVTTPVDEPKPTDDGSVIPCSLWFFSICIRWDDFDIFGWEIVLPPGIYPPGPPPPFSIDPSALFTIDVTGILPEWPEFTIGPDRQPTFPPKPSNGPDGECETESAELCATRTSYGVSVSGEQTTTTNTQVLSTCGTVYGCNVRDVSVTETTTAAETATGTPISHVVYPKEGRNETQVGDIEEILFSLVNDTSKIYASDTTSLGLNFWRLPITIEQADELRKVEDVGSVMEECDNDAYPCWDPTIELVYQTDAPAQLSYVSWPDMTPRVRLEVLQNRYYFDDSSGQNVDVWVMDTGATADHPEFDLIRDRFDWVIKVPDWDGQSRQDDSYTDLGANAILSSHGTSMLSLVAGKTVGVAKNINAHIARLPRKRATGMGFTPEDYLETLAEVNERMTGDGSTASGVLLLAQMYQRNFFYRLKGDGTTNPLTLNGATFDESFGFEWRLHTLLEQIMAKGNIVVTGAGNVQSATIDGWPQNFGKNSGILQLPDIIVVGAVTPGEPGASDVLVYGSTDLASGLPHVYAPGYNMMVADGNRQLWNADKTEGIHRTGKGTSDASAMTAGLVASFLRLAQLGQLNNADGTAVANTPVGIRNYLLAKSWSRGQIPGRDGTSDRNGICNAVDLTKPACSWNPNPPTNQRRQEDGGSCELPLDPTTTTAEISTTEDISTTAPPAPPLTDLPTLTDVGTIVTPSGSSCAETGTVTQCIPGSGGQSACVENPTCVSWVNTMPPTTTEAPPPVTTTQAPPVVTEPPVTPLELAPVVCVDEGTLPGHGDINGDTQGNLADVFCEVEPLDNGVSDMGPGDQPLERLREANDEINYYYSISWVDGCVTSVARQDVLSPIGDGGASCKDILISTYNNCNNGGVGGYIDAGCLRYSFIGGE
ncbi:hypothetical protein B0J13DRAFT_638583 [Dactylonectria estremocensis]|uniref:Peptidase S8/S53 domain-containing protein n=1 Tax=Dactylonectria estremocensis TaxID=1079267 RepID=A0A9P9J2F8_9HYPO|nr:hypothetical protein B0J13DRAFT_638583 [Dactylonectria estremocensis]